VHAGQVAKSGGNKRVRGHEEETERGKGGQVTKGNKARRVIGSSVCRKKKRVGAARRLKSKEIDGKEKGGGETVQKRQKTGEVMAEEGR